MKRSLQSRGKQLFRYSFGVVALFYVVSQGQWQGTIKTLSSFSRYILVLLSVFVIGGLLFRFLRWYAIIQLEAPIQFRTAAEIDLIISFVNQLLPSRLSGSATAPLIINKRTGISMGTSIGITGINTALYAVIYAIVGGLGVMLLISDSSESILGIIGVSTLLYLITGLTILVSGFKATTISTLLKRLTPIIRRIPVAGIIAVGMSERIPNFAEESITVFQNILYSPLILCLYVAGWIGSVALFPALRVATLFTAFGTPFTPLIALPAILIAAYSVTLLPLTPGGIGVTEATAAAVFVSLGIPYEIAAATVLIDRVLGVYLPALLGWYPIIRDNPLTINKD